MSMVTKMLRKGRSLINKGWCQGDFAKDKEGKRVQYFSKKAVEFCAGGALLKARHILKARKSDYYDALSALDSVTKNGCSQYYNDYICKSKAQAVKLFDRGIKQAAKKKR